MGIKIYKPTSPGRRGMTVVRFEELTRDQPEKNLTVPLQKHAGRNHTGKMTVRHRGGGHKRKYRLIDFKRQKDGIPGRVASLEYDPNRSANIALVYYADGEKRYILAAHGLKVGQTIISGPTAEMEVGNTLELKDIPVGAVLHNIELEPGRGGQIVRAAGTSSQLMAKEGKYATLRLPSGEMRKVHLKCRATIGIVSNIDHQNIKLGKAGRKRHKGIRPTTRGSVMNPNDHPHGGGEGKAPIGMAGPKTPWGKSATKRTRGKKRSDKLIVRSRHERRRR